MGYYSWHCIDIINLKEGQYPDEVIEELRNNCEEARRSVDYDGHGTEHSKWYDCHQDLLQFSKKYPELIFQLYREGEDRYDTVNAYFKNGCVQFCPAQIHYDEFDEEKLEDENGNHPYADNGNF